MSRRLVLVCCSSVLATNGPAMAWLWSTMLAELVTLPPGTVVLMGDDRAPEALVWAAATQVGLPRVSYKVNGERHSSTGRVLRWTDTRKPAHALRARALVTAARDARDATWEVEVVGLLGGHVSGRNETMRRLTMARAEGLTVREHRLPAQFGGCVVEVGEERAA